MLSVQQGKLNFNKNFLYDFEGGNLSSDSGLLIVRSFVEKLGVRKLLEDAFNGKVDKPHKNASIIEQLIYTTIAGYSSDNASNALKNDPIFVNILNKNDLASQPTISRLINALGEDEVDIFNRLLEILYEKGNPAHSKKEIILDLDSTLFETFGQQEETSYNYHYNSKGYHPLMLFDGVNGDLMKVELRNGKVYTSNNVKVFMESILYWIDKKYPGAKILLRGDSGFAVPELYELCEEYGIEFVIRLKSNSSLKKHATFALNLFEEQCAADYTKNHELYDDFYYKANSWKKPLRVICKVERALGELLPRATFIVSTLKSGKKVVAEAYNKRGNMENYIKEVKRDFFMECASHSNFLANAIKTLIKGLAYNIINIMKRTVLPEDNNKQQLLSIRTKFIKIACRVVKTARRTIFKICSSYPWKIQFQRMMENVNAL